MKALFKTLFGDSRNLAGVGLMIAVAAALTAAGQAAWAVFLVPIVGVGVIFALASH